MTSYYCDCCGQKCVRAVKAKIPMEEVDPYYQICFVPILLPVDGGIGAVDLIEIFNYSSYVDILKTFSVNEVIQKIQQYEDEKREELKFGDEVIAKKCGDSDAKKACVMYPNDGKSQCLVLKDTGTTEWWSKCWIRKTGRNYPEIEEVLKKMRE